MVRTRVSRGPLIPHALARLTFFKITKHFSQKRKNMWAVKVSWKLTGRPTERVNFHHEHFRSSHFFSYHCFRSTGRKPKNSSFVIKSTLWATRIGGSSAWFANRLGISEGSSAHCLCIVCTNSDQWKYKLWNRCLIKLVCEAPLATGLPNIRPRLI